MRFGGENGIVAKKYSGYQKAVDKLRLITVKAKLTAIDLHNLDYTKPIYIGQFGQTYGLYSVETGENGICECQLIQLQAIKEVVVPDYYLTINGSASDISRAVGSSTITGDIPGTVAVGEGRALAVSKNETGDLRKGTISMQWHNIEASETTAYDVEVSQEP